MDVHERVRDLLDRAWDHVGGKDYSLKDMKVITSKMETVITNNVEVANWPNDVPSPGFVPVFNSVQVSDKDKEEAKQKADATQCDGINANNQRCSATWGTLKAQGEVMFGVLIPKRCAAHKQRLDRPFCSFCAADHPNTATQYWWKEYDPAEGLDQATFFAGGSNWGDIVSRDSSFPYDNICDTCGQEETFKGKLFVQSTARTIYSNFVKKEQQEKKKRKALGRVWKQQQKRLRGETCNHGSGDCPNPVGFHFSDQTFAVGEGPPSRHCAQHKIEGMVELPRDEAAADEEEDKEEAAEEEEEEEEEAAEEEQEGGGAPRRRKRGTRRGGTSRRRRSRPQRREKRRGRRRWTT